MSDQQVTDTAIAIAKKIKKKIARKIVDHLPQEAAAVSVFMAGSPGAGKTETARQMIKMFRDSSGVELVHRKKH
jgi:UDP-N-acetylglucosamine kinase